MVLVGKLRGGRPKGRVPPPPHWSGDWCNESRHMRLVPRGRRDNLIVMVLFGVFLSSIVPLFSFSESGGRLEL